MYRDLISEPANKQNSGYVDGVGWSGVGGGCLDVLNESTTLSLPEDVAETDSSAAAGYRLSFAIRTGGMEMVSTADNNIQRLVNKQKVSVCVCVGGGLQPFNIIKKAADCKKTGIGSYWE